ncbi:hypothetical protein [Amycolatopsis sp. CA-230715]|uniref:hypothetical protein n=1 Tax=Amycolatopsis sp. CA-230715 TaxID=2745196 RepID=UPI001C02CE53|nr:hypothetical protein [Amycolatopsis sp. CA-230715]QWF80885.1 hypothetical protein HUW46_04310 [Amycolatopsis sp. CA-230715]
MLRPFVAYLRVYEPLSAFGEPPGRPLLDAVKAAKLTRGTVGEREQRMWLKSQTAAPVRLLPAELADGKAAPSTRTDVLVLDPADVPSGGAASEPYVCPLELRARSAAALVNFLGDAHPTLRASILSAGGVTAETVRSRTTSALGELLRPAVHVLSTTWTVPLPWFAIVEPEERKLVLGKGRQDPARELSWRVAMSDAVIRVAEAQDLVENTLGESGPARILAETGQWLDNFDDDAVIELDYGGLVQLLDDETLSSDHSAEDVHGILDALRTGNVERLGGLFSKLREYWAGLASQEHHN